MLSSIRSYALALSLAASLLVSSGCAIPATMNTGTDAAPVQAAPVPVPGKLTVEGAHARPAPLQGGNGAVFLTVLNGTDNPVRLAGVASSVAESVELHESTSEDGVMKMAPRPDGFEIPAGGSVELAPGGKHVMLIGLVQPLTEGQAFSLTLSFDNGETINLSVPVLAMDAMSGMDQPAETPTTQP